MEFSHWTHWRDRNQIKDIQYPGIYILIYSEKNISGRRFEWLKEIFYIGMTNSYDGLKGRLQQFENTIAGKTGHGGAERVMYKYDDYKILVSHLYITICPFVCDVKSNSVNDLQIMGKVAEYEYVCFSEYVKRFKRLPEFNDKKRSPKKKKSVAVHHLTPRMRLR